MPEDVRYLQNYDQMKIFIHSYQEMLDRLIDLLTRFLNQSNGKLSARARKKEFSLLTDQEIETIESKYTEIFG